METNETGSAAETPRIPQRRPWPIDKPLLVLLGVYALMLAPLVPRSTANPQLLAAFINDEPLISLQLVGMGLPPYGNPANLLKEPGRSPREWGFITYPGIMYYGGTYLDLGFLVYLPCKLLNLPDFPTVPIILRSVSFLSGGASLIIIYVLARGLGGNLAGFAAGLLLLSDSKFAYYSSLIHPDTTMLALALFALWVASRHARTGNWRSLLALGLLAGVIHGTKMGGPWVIPMALTAQFWGHAAAGHFRQTKSAAWRRILLSLAGLGLAAGIGFILTTPYAILDSYYSRMVKDGWKLFRDNPWTGATPRKWLTELGADLGVPLFCLALLGLMGTGLSFFLKNKPKTLILTAILGVSVIAWYSVTVKLWVVIGYLLTGLACVYILIALLIAGAITWLQKRDPWAYRLANGLVVLLILTVINYRGWNLANYVLYQHLRDSFTGVEVGRWAETHLPHQSKILFDDVAYFNPKVFPEARLYGGLMTYKALEKYKPDYFLLSENIYGCPHYRELRKTQHDARGQESPFSVLLYQDLIDRDLTDEAELVTTFSAKLPGKFTGWQFTQLLLRMALGLDDYRFGNEFRLYRYRPAYSSGNTLPSNLEK